MPTCGSCGAPGARKYVGTQSGRTAMACSPECAKRCATQDISGDMSSLDGAYAQLATQLIDASDAVKEAQDELADKKWALERTKMRFEVVGLARAAGDAARPNASIVSALDEHWKSWNATASKADVIHMAGDRKFAADLGAAGTQRERVYWSAMELENALSGQGNGALVYLGELANEVAKLRPVKRAPPAKPPRMDRPQARDPNSDKPRVEWFSQGDYGITPFVLPPGHPLRDKGSPVDPMKIYYDMDRDAPPPAIQRAMRIPEGWVPYISGFGWQGLVQRDAAAAAPLLATYREYAKHPELVPRDAMNAQ